MLPGLLLWHGHRETTLIRRRQSRSTSIVSSAPTWEQEEDVETWMAAVFEDNAGHWGEEGISSPLPLMISGTIAPSNKLMSEGVLPSSLDLDLLLWLQSSSPERRIVWPTSQHRHGHYPAATFTSMGIVPLSPALQSLVPLSPIVDLWPLSFSSKSAARAQPGSLLRGVT